MFPQGFDGIGSYFSTAKPMCGAPGASLTRCKAFVTRHVSCPARCLDLPGGDASNGNMLWVWGARVHLQCPLAA